jgi:hypothetical protein
LCDPFGAVSFGSFFRTGFHGGINGVLKSLQIAGLEWFAAGSVSCGKYIVIWRFSHNGVSLSQYLLQ